MKALRPSRSVAGVQAEDLGTLDSEGGYRGREWKDLRHIFLGRTYKAWRWTGYVCTGKIERVDVKSNQSRVLQRAIEYIYF